MPSALGWYLLGLGTPAFVLSALVVLYSVASWALGWGKRPVKLSEPRAVLYADVAALVRAQQAQRDAAAVNQLLKSL